ncbi:MAG: alginate export family protein [Muribaculaceae bacterium]
MKKLYFLLFIAFILPFNGLMAQSNNALSIYEGERIQGIDFAYIDLPTDSLKAIEMKQKIENTFRVYPYSHFSEFQVNYGISQIRNIPFVSDALLTIIMQGDGGVKLVITTTLNKDETITSKNINIFKNLRSFPVIYSNEHSFLTAKFSASEMAYSNNNAWFAQPDKLLVGNPLANGASGKGYSAWIEGFAMGGIYGITRLSAWQNLHIYGGTSYIVSFSAGNELFTNKARIYGDIEDAFVGIIGGKRLDKETDYSYSIFYGRKQFVLGNGWLIINTSMNGQERAALQLNPRWAARNLFQAGFRWNKMHLQVFQLRPNELPIFYSHTIINGLNLEWDKRSEIQLGITALNSPRSDVKYYMPDGTIHYRKGLWVYNLRLYGNPPTGENGIFYKAEAGLQNNSNFKMRAYAWYTQLGWNFAKTQGKPSLSYRFAYFSGDNPNTKAYERWDALYTGGTGEQWVQGSNMYKLVQNSNEMTHMVQLSYSPIPKIQTVTQIWSFLAPQKNNLGGNPGLSTMKSNYYGTELNFTFKYFHSRNWYFHLNTAITFPGNAITSVIPDTKTWFCLMAFIRYSL